MIIKMPESVLRDFIDFLLTSIGWSEDMAEVLYRQTKNLPPEEAETVWFIVTNSLNELELDELKTNLEIAITNLVRFESAAFRIVEDRSTTTFADGSTKKDHVFSLQCHCKVYVKEQLREFTDGFVKATKLYKGGLDYKWL